MGPSDTLRDDLASVEIDGDLVIYDPVGHATHVLSGGAVIVFGELAGDVVDGLVERVAARVDAEPDDLAAEVEGVLVQLDELGLLTSSSTRTPTAEHDGAGTAPQHLPEPPVP